MPDLSLALDDAGVKRKRRRVESLSIDKEVIANRIHKFYTDDTTDRAGDIDNRLQRYAKMRMWTSRKDAPWEDASDAAVPDILTHSLRVQDTLHNAVMSMRPAIVSKAITGKEDMDKQDKVDNLIDFQVFVENNGEKMVGDCADAFVNDGVMTIYVPWVREERDVTDIRLFDPIPEESVPIVYFKELLLAEYPEGDLYKRDTDGWEWEVEEGDLTTRVSFFTRYDDKVEMLVRKRSRVFDGPCPMVLDYEDVIHPPGVENLQAPGPSNPNGSTHVIIKSYPTLDEIRRLAKKDMNGKRFYDMISDEELEKLAAYSSGRSLDNQQLKLQQDRMQGVTDTRTAEVASHRELTRLMCFDMFDIDGDGLDEDVIFWMILETKTLLKAVHLTEMFPSDPPRRPFAEASFIPIRGRRSGISLPELMEGSHDLLKQIYDQVVDGGTWGMLPFGFYRPQSSMKPEVIRTSPGELYPLNDPKNDIYFPNMPSQNQSFGLNMMTIIGQQEDKLAMQSEMSFGRVPKGQASALRTAEGQQMLMAQGEARPERILRRFFMGLCEMWAQIHELNQRFLPEGKKYRISGVTPKEKDPYNEIKQTKEITGRFQFDFHANVLNSSKQALQASLQNLLGVLMSPLTFQMGMVTPENAYNLLRDYTKAWGQDADRYLTPPQPGLDQPGILAEEAIHAILIHEHPNGRPLEGAQAHLQKLIAFMQSDDFGYLDQTGVQMFQEYAMSIRELALQEMQQQMLAQMAGQMAGGMPAPAPPGMSKPMPNMANAPVNGGEVIDESLPSAKGQV